MQDAAGDKDASRTWRD